MSEPNPLHGVYDVPITRHCFGCGTENRSGLGLSPTRDGAVIRASYRPRPDHRGFSRTVHGGLVAALFDEVMAVATEVLALVATVELTVRYLRPAPMEGPLELEALDKGELPKDARRRCAEAVLQGPDGAILATAEGVYQPIPGEKMKAFLGRDTADRK